MILTKKFNNCQENWFSFREAMPNKENETEENNSQLLTMKWWEKW